MHNMYCVHNLNELQYSMSHDCSQNHCMMEWTKLVVVIHSLCVCCVALSQLMQDWYKETALIEACYYGHLETAKLLLHRGAVVNHQNRVRVLL